MSFGFVLYNDEGDIVIDDSPLPAMTVDDLQNLSSYITATGGQAQAYTYELLLPDSYLRSPSTTLLIRTDGSFFIVASRSDDNTTFFITTTKNLTPVELAAFIRICSPHGEHKAAAVPPYSTLLNPPRDDDYGMVVYSGLAGAGEDKVYDSRYTSIVDARLIELSPNSVAMRNEVGGSYQTRISPGFGSSAFYSEYYVVVPGELHIDAVESGSDVFFTYYDFYLSMLNTHPDGDLSIGLVRWAESGILNFSLTRLIPYILAVRLG